MLFDKVAKALRLRNVLLFEPALLVNMLLLQGLELVLVFLLERPLCDLHLGDHALHLEHLLRLVTVLLLKLVDHLRFLGQHRLEPACMLLQHPALLLALILCGRKLLLHPSQLGLKLLDSNADALLLGLMRCV